MLSASEAGLVRAQPSDPPFPPRSTPARTAAERMLARACDAFASYFTGSADALSALPLDPRGSDFQRCVWRALRDIPLGVTASYGEIARRIGRPNAARAVGDANRRNPIAIAIPCHRVIGGDGRLVGYAGGLERKRWLIAHEARMGALRDGGMRFASACYAAASSKSNGPELVRESIALARRRDSAAASI